MTFFIGTPHSHNAGYAWNDDRPSGGVLAQADVQTCPHCQAVIKMQEWQTIGGGWCAKCEAPICNNVACIAETNRLGCVPFMRKLEAHIENTVKYEQHLKVAGLEPSPQSAPALILPY